MLGSSNSLGSALHTGAPQLGTQCSAPLPASAPSSTHSGCGGHGARMHCTSTSSQCLPRTHSRLHTPPPLPPLPPLPAPALPPLPPAGAPASRSLGHSKPLKRPSL